MALPTSGQLTLAQIRDEFGAGTTSNVSLRTLSSAAGLSTPDGFNEFYGLSAYTPPTYITGASSVSGAGTVSNPYIVNGAMPREIVQYQETFDDYFSCFYEGAVSASLLTVAVCDLTQRITFQSQQSGTQKMSVQVTSWNNNSQTGCPLSRALLRCDTNFTGISVNESSSGSVTGASQILNNVYTATDTSFNTGSYVYIAAGITQLVREDVDRCAETYVSADETYNYCSSNLSVTSFTMKVWFEPV